MTRGGVRLSCRDWGGCGRPVVLLHGLAGHAGEWDTLAGALSPRYRVIAVDQRGHGASERFPREVSRAAYVADVVAVLDQLALHRPVLVGQSLGGHTAMLTAAAHPHLAHALVLVEAGPGGPNPRVQAEIGGWLDAWPTPFPSRESAVEFLGGGLVGEGWAAGLEERDGWWPCFDREIMVASLAEIAQRSFWDEWARITCPVLTVLGQSGIISPQESETMLRRLPVATAASVPGAGHDVHLERPAVLRHLIQEFLEENAAPRGPARRPGRGRDRGPGRLRGGGRHLQPPPPA
ncbi:hydrolase [Streptomyces avermitilis]|uniref:Hydrolase n=1 Tax=Streptomyces avermitilis (strain ATCC 31267 / DSM 46492 / JCM 5070 / NBRC 14893 / NCIMB 12804 / NRRL 8165 / MA-4680) TaxID=227882 RepID=Q82QI7_STRAW|nr:hydrolase [Streptomyces avermitilis]BAC68229.1 putative hydrolase [Streptomyces avermitilis MA-4680 = NBRC 14893]